MLLKKPVGKHTFIFSDRVTKNCRQNTICGADFSAERASLYILSINKRLYETANIEEKDSF